MRYTQEMLEAIAKKLRDMPPIEEKTKKYNKQEAVRILSKEIASLKTRGYTIDQIAETLRGEGLDIATPTLRSYLQRVRPGTARKQNGRTKKDTPPAPPRPAVKEQATSRATRATFTPTPDSDDI